MSDYELLCMVEDAFLQGVQYEDLPKRLNLPADAVKSLCMSLAGEGFLSAYYGMDNQPYTFDRCKIVGTYRHTHQPPQPSVTVSNVTFNGPAVVSGSSGVINANTVSIDASMQALLGELSKPGTEKEKRGKVADYLSNLLKEGGLALMKKGAEQLALLGFSRLL